MEQDRLLLLVNRYLTEILKDEERQELSGALEDAALEQAAKELILQHLENREFNYNPSLNKLHAKIEALVAEERKQASVHGLSFPRRQNRVWKFAAAAVFIAVMVFTGKQLMRNEPAPTASVYKNDVAPGKAGGKLKLNSGQIFSIDSLKEGFITRDAGLEIYKENGQIVYKGVASNSATEVAYNEIIEDRGRFTSVVLPDGSTAWVNSGSSIRYPLHFTASERKVTMTGRAAFQVVHNSKQPFRVYVKDQMFEDIGTDFNIDAYDDEPVITLTVREGTVKSNTNILSANQQARIRPGGKTDLLDNIETEGIFAWRSNEFSFTNASVETILKEAQRWYDVEIVYQTKVNQQYNFAFDRNAPISKLLRYMEISGGVHFDVEGKKITVRP